MYVPKKCVSKSRTKLNNRDLPYPSGVGVEIVRSAAIGAWIVAALSRPTGFARAVPKIGAGGRVRVARSAKHTYGSLVACATVAAAGVHFCFHAVEVDVLAVAATKLGPVES